MVYLLGETNVAGIAGLMSLSAAATVNVDLIGWVDWAVVDADVTPAGYPTGGWDQAITSQADAIVWLRATLPAGAWGDCAARTTGSGLDTQQIVGAGSAGGCADSEKGPFWWELGDRCLSSVSDAAKHVDLKGTVAASVFEHGSATGTPIAAIVFGPATKAAALENLDLSAHTGAGDALVVLSLFHNSAAAQSAYFRYSGDAGDPTSSDLNWPSGSNRFRVDPGKVAQVTLPVRGGIVEWGGTVGGPAYDWTVRLELFVASDAPPTITDWHPTGSDEAPLVPVAFKDDDDVGVVSNSQALTLTPPVGAPLSPLVAGAAALPHWIATITPNGTATGYTVVLTHTVDLYPPGAWAADAYCEDGGGLSASRHWHFGVAALSFVEGTQVRLNAVRVELDDEPTHSDQSLATDGLCLSIYTVAGPAVPLLQCVTWDLSDPNALTLWFDGPLVPGETYAITVAAGLKSTAGLSLFPAVTFGFVAFGEDRAPVPLRLQQAESYDLRNPQSVLDGDTGVPLAQLLVDEMGDLDVEGRLAALKKRCFRRLSTLRSAFVHLPGYGLENRLKTLARPSDLRRLQQDAAAQLAQEPDVTRVRVTVSQPGPGETVITAQVTAPYGTVDLEVSP
jgi:hypothetical protein